MLITNKINKQMMIIIRITIIIIIIIMMISLPFAARELVKRGEGTAG